ncbi:hypothetical protein NQ314_020353 [Rhamnusium bicolor]|uniref:PiggyBac transposable element-derived protein domain-containing protein n=1 Tax=Rhamnusium bicolor TaxID=1586634 RepID=A0AAV8WLX0_9CUCU|nr:hypothetical protein NQ314_020353 [Rhamnusium bicolor]
MWVLLGVSGFSYNFELFTGKENNPDANVDFGAASNVVVRMCQIVPDNIHHKVYFDNYFCSLNLISYLHNRGIDSVATVRSNRLLDCKVPSDKVFKKRGRGSYEEQQVKIGNCTIRTRVKFCRKSS